MKRISDRLAMLDLGEDGQLHPALIRGDEGMVLIDAGLPGQIEELTAQLGGAEALARVRMLVLTHQDLDHIGCARDLRQRVAGITVAAHETEAPMIEGTRTPTKMEPLVEREETLDAEERERLAFMRRGFQHCTVPVDRRLVDGEVIEPWGLTVIHTPGHTPGHICLYARGERTLIAGDTLSVENGRITLPAPQYTKDMDELKRSLQRLAAYEIEHVICYHGGLFTGDLGPFLRSLKDA